MSIESQKLDILLSFKGEFNIQDTEDPAVYTMPCGGGFTLFASLNKDWVMKSEDGSEYPVNSDKIPYINGKDALELLKKFEEKCKRMLEVDSYPIDDYPDFDTPDPMPEYTIKDEKKMIGLIDRLISVPTSEDTTIKGRL